MKDRELLELAAKAAGWRIDFLSQDDWANVYDAQGRHSAWNPLADDGDALRLAVQLRITPHIDGNLTEAESTEGFCTEPHFDDALAATRRAITRAAAEIGKAMQ